MRSSTDDVRIRELRPLLPPAILMEELPVLPIYIYTRTYLKSKEVQGWHPNVEDIHPLRWVSLSPKS